MPANRKRIGVLAPPDAWKRLGELLEAHRRVELGYRSRVAFAADRLPPTAAGNANIRLVSDIENSYRPDTYPAGTLREIARAYGVTYESVLAVLEQRPGIILAPDAPGTPAPLPVPGLPRDGADRAYAAPIIRRVLDLAERGITRPSGAQVFPDAPDDAKTWDGIGARMDASDRIWLIADLRRRADRRSGGSETG